MSAIGPHANALQTAWTGIGRASRGVQQAAAVVAAGIDSGDSGPYTSALAGLPDLKLQVSANVSVAGVAGEMLEALLTLGRR